MGINMLFNNNRKNQMGVRTNSQGDGRLSSTGDQVRTLTSADSLAPPVVEVTLGKSSSLLGS